MNVKITKINSKDLLVYNKSVSANNILWVVPLKHISE